MATNSPQMIRIGLICTGKEGHNQHHQSILDLKEKHFLSAIDAKEMLSYRYYSPSTMRTAVLIVGGLQYSYYEDSSPCTKRTGA